MKKDIICTVCPLGCHIAVEGEGEKIISMEGYGCARGKQYATTEFSHPVRILTSTIRTDSDRIPLIPVRSSEPLPKEMLMNCMVEIRKCRVHLPIRSHEILISDICNTGIDIVATADIS